MTAISMAKGCMQTLYIGSPRHGCQVTNLQATVAPGRGGGGGGGEGLSLQYVPGQTLTKACHRVDSYVQGKPWMNGRFANFVLESQTGVLQGKLSQ